jgi:HAD superfamily hydrolase (TIGR01509 family)
MAENSTVSTTNISTGTVKAVLFDLDGVIIDSEPLHVRALQLTCTRFGFTLLPEDIIRFKGVTELQVARYFINGRTNTAPTLEDFIDYKSEIYTRLIKEELTLVDGVVEFIQFCRAQTWRIGLTTSALPENTATVLQKFDLAPYFHVIVTSGDITNSKPHPEPYLRTAQKLELHPADCLVIEDSVNGVRSGKTAGCRVVAITTSFPQRDLEAAGADWVVGSFSEAQMSLFGMSA